MPDVFTKAQRSLVMARIRGSNNKETERAFIRLLRDKRITGWRRNWPAIGRPDIVFPKVKVAIFVDGCFWHGCPVHGRKPGSNQDYWIPKLARNQKRDRAVNRVLVKDGWIVVRFWEHDLKNAPRVIGRVTRVLGRASVRLPFATK